MLTSIIAFVCAVFLTIKITLAEWFGLTKPKPSLKRWQVTRIYLFCEPNDTPLDDDAAEVVDATRFYDVDALTTGDEIIEHVTPYVPSDWPSWRCEIRFQKGECKRRAVVRHGESFDVSELNCLRSTRFSPKARLCTAWMTSQRKATKGKRIDVTERVEKYIMSPSRILHPLGYLSVRFTRRTSGMFRFVAREHRECDRYPANARVLVQRSQFRSRGVVQVTPYIHSQHQVTCSESPQRRLYQYLTHVPTCNNTSNRARATTPFPLRTTVRPNRRTWDRWCALASGPDARRRGP